MKLEFPNVSRSYDEHRGLIRFWGYDGALEISFVVEVGALQLLVPKISHAEAGYLKAFDAARDRIHQIARKVHSRTGEGFCLLEAKDF